MPRMSGGSCVIDYPLGESGQILVFSDVVIEHFKSHRQIRAWDREAGGQLFARIDGARIIVVEATGPRRGDHRTRTLYVPDRKAERFEIEDRFRLGLHFVGDWHTHPEKIPHPSDRDMKSIGESVLKSSHNLNGFVLAVVGTSNVPDCLSVLLHDGTQARTLYPA
jgi:integrative and conjugative element protein (TIGR02256 family)